MHFSVIKGGISHGDGNYNAASRRNLVIPGKGETFSETSYPQTAAEHYRLLNAYLGKPGINPVMARALGKRDEATCPRYWLSDSKPRYGGSTPSSSFIDGITISPGLNMATFHMNGKAYSSALSPNDVASVVNSNSLGSAYNYLVRRRNIKEPLSISPRTVRRSGL